jgi:hypothetical protein
VIFCGGCELGLKFIASTLKKDDTECFNIPLEIDFFGFCYVLMKSSKESCQKPEFDNKMCFECKQE